MTLQFPKPPPKGPRLPKKIARKTRPSAVRKTPLGRLKKKCFTLHSILVRHRDPWCVWPVSERCRQERQRTQDCAHIVSRRYEATAWDLSNAVGSCKACHLYYTKRPTEWRMRVVAERGEEFMADLEFRATDPSFYVNRVFVEKQHAKLKAEARRRGLL